MKNREIRVVFMEILGEREPDNPKILGLGPSCEKKCILRKPFLEKYV